MAAVHTGAIAANVVNFPAGRNRVRTVLRHVGEPVRPFVASSPAIPRAHYDVAFPVPVMANNLDTVMATRRVWNASEFDGFGLCPALLAMRRHSAGPFGCFLPASSALSIARRSG